jgi:hypothetical protein
MFSSRSASEPFHVANFGWAPRPFFFLAPSRNRGREDPRIADVEMHTVNGGLQYPGTVGGRKCSNNDRPANQRKPTATFQKQNPSASIFETESL